MNDFLLTIDVGNTNTKMAVIKLSDYGIIASKIKPNCQIKKDTFYEDFLNFKTKFSINYCMISSVVPTISEIIVDCLKKVGINYYVVEAIDNMNMLPLDVDGKTELGSDIFCGCVASLKYGKDIICIDMGTAITIALVKNGRFIAVAIYPGVETSFTSLFKNASLLQDVKIEEPKKMIGGNTTDCLQTGMIYGTVGAIKQIINEYKKYVDSSKVVFTGGASKTFIKYFENCIYEENLIHFGLVDIYKERNK